MKPSLSVIIPTHNRAHILRECIRHLETQTIKDELEVIVVSDGHDDATEQLFHEAEWDIPVVFMEIEKSQQGVARNRGVEMASAGLCLFIGDDILPEKDCCEQHLHAERKNPGCAVLGFTTWDPECGVTDVMKWLESSGWQFGYPMIEKYAHEFLPATIQHKFTYTSNISVPTTIAKAHPFLEEIRLYGWEDIEWGHRKKRAGIRVFYEPDAKALHHHHITMEDSLKRMEVLGRSARRIRELHPELNVTPSGLKLLGYHVTSLLPTMMGRHRKAFLRGLRTP